MDPRYQGSTALRDDPRMTRTSPEQAEAEALDALETSPSLLKRISWGAIFAGAAVASVLSIWLNMLGVAIGLAVFEPAAQQATGFGIGTVIWVLGSAILSLFAGGWLAGRLTGTPRRFDRALHGVVAWSVATLFGLYVLTSGAGSVLSGTASALGGIAGAATPAVGGALQQAQLPPEVEQDLEGLLQEAQRDPQLRQSIAGVIQGEATPQERDRVVQELSERTDLSPPEIEQRLARWEQQAATMKQELARTAEKAATAASGVAFLGVGAMFVGLCASTLGAASAKPERRRL